jgi:hypothetical protein
LAELVFAGPHVSVADSRFDYGETRQVAFGFIRGRLFVCVYADRGAERTVQEWERGAKRPSGSARTLLRAIKGDPEGLRKALAAA